MKSGQFGLFFVASQSCKMLMYKTKRFSVMQGKVFTHYSAFQHGFVLSMFVLTAGQ